MCLHIKRKTHEEFCKQVYDLYKNEYTILGEYNGSKEKILVQHNCNKCHNYRWYILPSNLLKGRKCPKCFGNLKKTKEQIQNIICQKFNNEYELLEEYKGMNTKIKVRHKKCGFEWYTSPNVLLRRGFCPICSNKIKLTDEMYKYKINYLYNGEYEVLSKYKTIKTLTKFRHNKCGYIFYKKPTDFKNNTLCPICTNSKHLTQNEFKKKLFNLVGNEYIMIGEFKNMSTPIIMKHNINNCNHIWKVSPTSFFSQRATRCPKCFGNHLKTQDEFCEEVHNLVGDEYTILEEYIDAKTKIHIQHNNNNCNNNILYISPNSFLRGTRCPICNESKGEMKIRQILQNNNIFFIKEYKFFDLKDEDYLRFDFAIFNNKNKTTLDCLIEYDGEFHYKPIQSCKNESMELAKERLKKQKNMTN